jgi:hypothetical protein
MSWGILVRDHLNPARSKRRAPRTKDERNVGRSFEVGNIIANQRLRKAIALANTLTARGFTLDLVRVMEDHAWHIAAVAAGTKPPSTEIQKTVVTIFELQEGNGSAGSLIREERHKNEH